MSINQSQPRMRLHPVLLQSRFHRKPEASPVLGCSVLASLRRVLQVAREACSTPLPRICAESSPSTGFLSHFPHSTQKQPLPPVPTLPSRPFLTSVPTLPVPTPPTRPFLTSAPTPPVPTPPTRPFLTSVPTPPAPTPLTCHFLTSVPTLPVLAPPTCPFLTSAPVVADMAHNLANKTTETPSFSNG